MNILALKQKVLTRIDEAAADAGDIALRYNIEEFLQEATFELLKVVPLNHLPSAKKIASKPQPNLDGSGRVELGDDFLKLLEFRMVGWRRSVFRPLIQGSKEYLRQFNPTCRGGVAKPQVAVVLKDGKQLLEYFSLPPEATHEIEVATYIPRCTPDQLPDSLSDILCWLAAHLVLSVCNDAEGAAMALGRYKQLLSLL